MSQLYLAGRGVTSYFDIRSIYYTGYSELDQQSQLPIVHPVLDYSAVLPQQILGGELSYKVNITSLSRQQASFDPITLTAQSSICANGSAQTADPALLNKTNCLLRGCRATIREDPRNLTGGAPSSLTAGCRSPRSFG